MAVTLNQYTERVQAWINEKWPPQNPCPMCHTVSGWELAAPLEILIRPDIEGTQRGRVIPVVPLVCNNCSYMVFLGALKIGVLPGTPQLDMPVPDSAGDGGK